MATPRTKRGLHAALCLAALVDLALGQTTPTETTPGTTTPAASTTTTTTTTTTTPATADTTTTTTPPFVLEIASALDSDAATTQVPTGCFCVETGAANSTCSKFDCPCLCDLTAARCDPNCCCDAECQTTVTNYSTSMGTCLEDGTEADSINMCYDAAELFTVNAKFRMDKSVVGELLCVAIDNNPAVGNYFDNSEAALSDVDSSANDGFRLSGVEYPDRSDEQYFLVGDGISVLANSTPGGPFQTGFGGFLQAPVPGLDGQCAEAGIIGFMTDAASTCSRQVVDENGECVVDPYASVFVNTLWLGAVASVDSDTELESFVQVSFDETESRVEDFSTGAASSEPDFAVVRAWFAEHAQSVVVDTTFPPSDIDTTTPAAAAPGTSSSSPTVAPSLAPSPATNTTAAREVTTAPVPTTAPPSRRRRRRLQACGCDFVLTQVKFTVYYDDGASNITGASVALQYAEDVGSCSALWMNQEFIVEFVPRQISFTQSYALGNFVERSKSGNPGYLVGLPVLSGTKFESSYEETDELLQVTTYDTSRILQDDGLRLTASNSMGGCANAETYVVPFGQNSSSQCTLSLTLGALMQRCEDDSLVFDNWQYNSTYIGKFGNADPLNLDNWLELEVPANGIRVNSLPGASGRQCNDVVDSIDYEFVTMNVGSIANPQQKIIRASVSYQTSDWVFRQALNSQPQAFTIKTSVTFLAMNQDADLFVPIMPAIIPELPWDVFYPFVAQNGAGLTRTLPSAAATVLAAVVAVVLPQL